jgi:ABC-2 type transport system permease protein
MSTIITMALKDLKLLLRDRMGFFFVFFFPLMYAIFFGLIFSGEGGGMSAMDIVLVDEDRTEASRKFGEKLKGSEELEVTEAQRSDAEAMVRRGKRTAYVILPEGFGASRQKLFQGKRLKIEVGVDPARKAEAGMLQGVITQYAFQILQDLFTDREAMKEQALGAADTVRKAEDIDPVTRTVLGTFLQSLTVFLDTLPESEGGGVMPGFNPIEVKIKSIAREKTSGPKSSFDITMPQSFVWVFIGCAAAFGISLVTERTRGTLVRLRSAPITLGHILAGKALACFMMNMSALLVLFAFFHFVFKVRPDSYGLLLLAFLCSTMAFVGVMMLISVLGKTEASAGGIGWAILLVMAMLGGGMVPLIMLPSWMKTVSHISFVKWTVLSIEGAVWRGFTLGEMLLPCSILLGIGAVCFALGVRLFRVTVD